MYGPNGLEHYMQKMRRITTWQGGGGMTVVLKESNFASTPTKFEAGTINSWSCCFSEAIKFMEELGLKNSRSRKWNYGI